MNSINLTQDSKHYGIYEVPINGGEMYELYDKISATFLNESYNISFSWELKKVLQIKNSIFEQDFTDKSKEFQNNSSYPEHWFIRYGFLATIKEKMIDRVAMEGLEVKMCPYNYLGYNIAGVHISQNADICLNEARSKIVVGDELILIIFKYMLGKRKIVAMHDPKILLAPTPKFDSHICEERPDQMEKESIQYIKSLVYLYEFANGNLDPVIRPRHCFPIAAIIFKHTPSHESLNCSGLEEANMFLYQSPLSLLKPVSQHNQRVSWGRQHPPSEFKKSSINLSKVDQEGSNVDKELYDIEKPTSVDDGWRSLKCLHHQHEDIQSSLERDRSPDRSKKWNDLLRSGKSEEKIELSLRNSSRGSKNWLK